MSIFTPTNQVKLTNVSVVRFKRSGKRFEIACYKNKVIEWRNGVETDLDNVLQTHSVFVNVSKGQLAKTDDLEKAFKTTDQDAICIEILKKGELQVSERERSQTLSNLYKDIATIISEKCVNPDTKRPYPVTLIEKAMQELHVNVHPTKPAKVQALDIIRDIQASGTLPIERARMRVRLVLPAKDGKRVKDRVVPLFATVDDDVWTSSEWEVAGWIDPGHYRTLTDLVQAETKGRGRLDLLNLSQVADGEEQL
ncbi:SBDS family rRNA metabolism protein [Allomyces macrogynus ATCC 38327]|uniref:Ribosome maturation protein SDO1 n=1 Tax=Allomyces macrogynus (strain ATCC 38327) TaxID=578462 RepID=A0A0L0SG72_ALLM3|nr:SBDS family rRNA metabolism protein [Allomyces macrogynus ATCC 38327]|eukprot:KNE61496.1 SBDS family rRNA metabolism protein [Allomyces macrogynus ATCC 38327]